MTQEQLKILAQYEKHMICAVEADYSPVITRGDLEQLRTIYEQERGVRWNHSLSCGACVVQLLKALHKMYVISVSEAELAEQARKDAKESDTEQNAPEVEEVPVKKEKAVKSKKKGK